MFHAGFLCIYCLRFVVARQDPADNYDDGLQEDVPQEFGDASADENDSSFVNEQRSRMSFMAVNDRARGQQRAGWTTDSMDSQAIPASFARIAQNIQRWKKPTANQESAAKDLKEFSQGWQAMGHSMASAAAQKEAMAVVSKLHVRGHQQGHGPEPAPAAQIHPSDDAADRLMTMQALTRQADQADDADNDSDDNDNTPDSASAESTQSPASGVINAVAKPSQQQPAWYHVPKVERKKPEQPMSQSIPAPKAQVPEDAALADAADREIEAEALDAPGADIPPVGAEFDDAAPPKQALTKAQPKKQQMAQQKKPPQQQSQPAKQPQQPTEASAPSFPLDGPDGKEVSVNDGSADDDAAIAAALKDAGLSTNALSMKDVDAGGDPVSPLAETQNSAAQPLPSLPLAEEATAPSSEVESEDIPSVAQVLDSDSSKLAASNTAKVTNSAKIQTQGQASQPPAKIKALKVPEVNNGKRETLSSHAAKAAKPVQHIAAEKQSSEASAVPQPVADVDAQAVQPEAVDQPLPAIPQATVSDAAVDGAAHEEVARARAELAAAELLRAADSKRKSLVKAQSLEQQAKQSRRDADAAWDRAQQVAAAAAQRAASEYKRTHMVKVNELEVKSRQASEKARRIRAAADAEVNKAMQSLGQISA